MLVISSMSFACLNKLSLPTQYIGIFLHGYSSTPSLVGHRKKYMMKYTRCIVPQPSFRFELSSIDATVLGDPMLKYIDFGD